MRAPSEPPPGWGVDPLTDFIEHARQNEFATYVRLPDHTRQLLDVCKLFASMTDVLHHSENNIAALLALRTHSAFLGASRMALSGQIAETYPLLRTVLESSLYSLHIYANDGSGKKWIRRHAGETELKQCKQEFTIANVMATLESTDATLLARTKALYAATIDFGGHPNERSIFTNLEKREGDGSIELLLIYLASDGPALRNGLKQLCRVGICALEIYKYVYAKRYEILGLGEELEEKRRILGDGV